MSVCGIYVLNLEQQNLTLPAKNGKLQTSHIINENPNKMGIDFQSNCWDGNKLNKSPGKTIKYKNNVV